MAIWNRLNNNEDDSLKMKPKIYSEVRPLVASASRVNLSLKDQVEMVLKMRAGNRWQADAWAYYDLVGEIKQAATLLANVTSRIRLYPAFIVDRDAIPSIIDDIDEIPDVIKEQANAAMLLLATGNGGISGLLRDAALNLFIAGECFLIREPAKLSTGEPEKWQIRSISEFVKSTYTMPDGKKETAMSIKESKHANETDHIKLPKGAFVGRIWRNHPEYSLDPDSSMLGVLELLDELLLIDRSARTTIRSRLNAGMLLIPDEIDQISQGDGEVDPADPEMAELSQDYQESIEENLMDAMTDPIKNEGSASAAAPIIFRGAAQYLKEVRHITFSREFDPTIMARNERVLERIMTSLDLPKDVMAGFANIKYSNAIIVEESLYKAHIEPLILMIVDALTVIFLRPILRGLNVPEDIVARATIWYDPSAITAKPDKATAASTGFDSQIISGQAWRRENGFSETDAPTQLELAQRMAVSKGLMSEPITEAILKTLIPDILNKVREESLAMTDPASAGALTDALATDTETAPTEETPAPTSEAPATDEQEGPPAELINP